VPSPPRRARADRRRTLIARQAVSPAEAKLVGNTIE